MRSVLLITDSEGFGGAEIAMCTAAEALARNGVQVTVAVPRGHERLSILAERLARSGVSVLQANGRLEPLRFQKLSRRLRRDQVRSAVAIIAQVRPDAIVINLQNIWSGASILDAATEWRGRAVVAGYAQLAHPPSRLGGRMGWVRDGLVPRHLSRFDVVLAVSETQAAALRGLRASCRVATVYQPVGLVKIGEWATKEEARRSLGLEGAPRLIGLVGRVVFRHKGHDVAVRVAKSLRQSGIRPHWAVVGDGPDLNRLRGLVDRFDLGDYFHFLGWREDLNRILPAFDVLAMPSRLEGMPLSAVEAMCARVPVVAFAVDGLVDLLAPPFAVPPFDEDRFAETIADVLRDPARWPGSERASLAARLCDPDAVAGRILAALGWTQRHRTE